MKDIAVGSIVAFTDPNGHSGWYRVTRLTKNTVNLGAVFGKHLYFKGVDRSLVREDEDAWYARWQQSEAYKCM